MDDPHAAREAASASPHRSPGKPATSPWKDEIAAARMLWRRLGQDELLRCEGELPKLTRLVQERYEISRYAAEMQARDFLGRWKNRATPSSTTGP